MKTENPPQQNNPPQPVPAPDPAAPPASDQKQTPIASFALRILGPGGIGGGLTLWLVSVAPDGWKGVVGASLSLFTALLANLLPYFEQKVVARIKKWWLKRQLKKSIENCEKIISDESTPPELKFEAEIALQRLQEASYRVVLSDAIHTAEASYDITGPLPSEVIKEARAKALEYQKMIKKG